MAGTHLSSYQSIFWTKKVQSAVDLVCRGKKYTSYSTNQLSSYKRELTEQVIEKVRHPQSLDFHPFLTKVPKTKGGKPERPISIYPDDERVIIRCLYDRLHRVLSPAMSGSSCYAVTPFWRRQKSRGVHSAVLKVSSIRRNYPSLMVLESDVKGFFGNVDQARLMSIVSDHLVCPITFDVLQRIIAAELVFDTKYFDPEEGSIFGDGLPQGAALSPLLATVYLAPFDRVMKSSGVKVVRYVDDFLLFYPPHSNMKLEEIEVRMKLKERFGLELHDEKTKPVLHNESIIFLGYQCSPQGELSLSPKRFKKVKERTRELMQKLPGNDQLVVRDLTPLIMSLLADARICIDEADCHRTAAKIITDELARRGLGTNRLAKLFRKSSSKWPSLFIEGLSE